MNLFIRATVIISASFVLLSATANAGTINGWIADRFADEILSGIAGSQGAEADKLRIAVKAFAPDTTPISARVANELNADLLTALMNKSEGRHVFVAREALKPLLRDVSQIALPGPHDPVESVLKNARADILVIGSIRRSRGDVILSYKAVKTFDGAVVASTQSQRFPLRDADLPASGLDFDQALAAAARYLVQRVDGLDAIQIGKIYFRNEEEPTPFASYLRDRMADELRQSVTGVVSATEIPVALKDGSGELDDGIYRLIGNYWLLGDSVELSLSLRGRNGVAVTWREKVRRRTIPAALALDPKVPQHSRPGVAALPWSPPQPDTRLTTNQARVQGLETVAEAQRLLQSLGYDPGPVDGFLTAQTRQAIMAFQRNNGSGPDGRMTRALVGELRTKSR